MADWVRYLPIPALLVAGAALYFAGRNYLLNRDKARREDEERRNKEAATAKFLAEFAELEVDGGDTRRYVWKYPATWDVPVNTVRVSEEEKFWLAQAIWKLPEWRPVEETTPPSLTARPIYMTDEARSYRSLVTGPETANCLALLARKGEGHPVVCYPDRRVIASGGEYCSKCHRPVAIIRAEAEEAEKTRVFPPRRA